MILQAGDTGDRVAALQQKLARAGHDLAIDGWFGTGTEAAVLAYQRAQGLVADGIAGPKTLAALRGKPLPRALRQADIEQAAQQLSVPVAVVQAVNEVESRGRGFFDNGRPVILFERHIMYRRLGQVGADRTALAEQHPDLVNPSPGGYIGGPREHERLAAAAELHPRCAPESASWGLFQIMGFHWRRLGYDSIEAFVDRMQQSEGEHLAAFVCFIERDPKLLLSLRHRNWGAFAARYNGPAYRRNAYDIKLARAFERHREAA